MGLFTKINLSKDFLDASKFTAKYFTQFGYKQDPYSDKDISFRESPMAASNIEPDISLIKYFKPISDQYSIGSCVANACADAVEMVIAKRNNILPSEVSDLSRLFIFWNARNLETPPDTSDERGSYIRLAMDSLMRYGVCDEKLWEYNISKFADRPTIIAYREAIKHRISKFYRITGTNSARIFEIKQALSAGYPVVFGTSVADSYRYVNSDSVVPLPTGNFIGGHAQLICGFDKIRNAFIVRNSWSTDWGIQNLSPEYKGYCFMSIEYVMSSISRDFWVFTI